MVKLHLDGLPEKAVRLGLLALRAEMGKLKKKLEEKEMDTAEEEELDAACVEVLRELGWRPKGDTGSNRVEAVRDDRQSELPLGAVPRGVVVQCFLCSRSFSVPVGDVTRACPDCGSIHRVKSDEDGVTQKRQVVVPPDDILALMIRETSDDLAPLTELEKETLEVWRTANPDHVRDSSLVEKGDRVADPGVVGSGNPLRIDCTRIVGNECAGFDSVDTPGTALCTNCGQKYTVRVTDGVVTISSWKPEDEDEDEDPGDDPSPEEIADGPGE